MRYCTEIKLPSLTDEQIKSAISCIGNNGANTDEEVRMVSFYEWYKLNDELQFWLHENIYAGDCWGIQEVRENLLPHKDRNTGTRILYIIDDGGDEVRTHFHDDDKNIILTVKMEVGKWYLMKTDVMHSVTGVESIRRALTVRIFSR